MEKQYNPLESWRTHESLTMLGAARRCGWGVATWKRMELSPDKSRVTTQRIFHLQDVTRIKLETLIDYFAGVTEEVA